MSCVRPCVVSSGATRGAVVCCSSSNDLRMADAHRPASFCTCRLLAVAATQFLSALRPGTKRRLWCALLLLVLLVLLLLLVLRVLCMLPCQPRSVRKALPAEGAMLAAANNCDNALP